MHVKRCIEIGGKKIKLFLFIDSSIMYLTNSKDFTKSFMN